MINIDKYKQLKGTKLQLDTKLFLLILLNEIEKKIFITNEHQTMLLLTSSFC